MSKERIWIDCGAWRGTSTKLFNLMHPNAWEYEQWLFEPDKKICRECLDKAEQKYRVFIDNRAIWDKDGECQFYIGKHGRGSTLIKEKTTGKLSIDYPITVTCIDFARFLCQFPLSSYMVCKMNIEGAEYAVLKHLIATDTLKYIKKLYICWHWSKIGVSKEEHNELSAKVSSLIPTYGWDLTEDENDNVDNEHNRKWFPLTFTKDDYNE